MPADSATLRAAPVAAAIRRSRLIAVLRRIEPRDRLLALVDDLLEAGVQVFEITFDAADAVADLSAVGPSWSRRISAARSAGLVAVRAPRSSAPARCRPKRLPA